VSVTSQELLNGCGPEGTVSQEKCGNGSCSVRWQVFEKDKVHMLEIAKLMQKHITKE
jgi:hypothetical protein